MSGIPRDYPAGMNQFPQILRGRAAALQGELLIRLVSRDLRGRETLQHVMVVGGGAANRKGAGAEVSSAFTPDPQQPAPEIARLSDGTPLETIREDADDLEHFNAWLLGRARELVNEKCESENTIGRMRSGINEAIALLEGGTEYERMHVAGTLRGAL